jgi:FkbM family methyltransferase
LKPNHISSVHIGDIKVRNNPFQAVSSTKLTRLNRLASEKSGIPGVLKKWLKRWIEYHASRILAANTSGKILVKISGRGTFEADECNGQMCVTYLSHYKTLYESDIEAILAAFLHEMDAFIDCGANWGYFTGKAIITNPNLLCWAIEPSPRVFEDLKRMTNALGQTGSVNLRNAGASSSRSKFILNESSFDSGTNHLSQPDRYDESSTQIDCITIDELEPPGKSLIKIDVEGHELEVLKGMDNLLSKAECIVLFEHWHDTTRALEPFYEYLLQFGYSIYQIQTELTASETPEFTRVLATLIEPSLDVGGRYNLMAIHDTNPLVNFRSSL